MEKSIDRLLEGVTGHLCVVITASKHGYVETALEAWMLAREKLQSVRYELLRSFHRNNQDTEQGKSMGGYYPSSRVTI
jgi:hypothetical protein